MIMTIDDPLLDVEPENFISYGKEITSANSAEIKYRVEITLNHPHTKPWMRLDFNEKMKFYKIYLMNIIQWFRCNYDYIGSDWHFELAGNHFHCHAYIDFKPTIPVSAPVSAVGICCAITDAWLSILPKRYDHCLKGNSFDNYDAYCERICIPQCNIQFRKFEKKRAEHWEEYIKKNI